MADVSAPRTLGFRPKSFKSLSEAEAAFNELGNKLERAYQLLVSDLVRLPVGSGVQIGTLSTGTDNEADPDIAWRVITVGSNFQIQVKVNGSWTTALPVSGP